MSSVSLVEPKQDSRSSRTPPALSAAASATTSRSRSRAIASPRPRTRAVLGKSWFFSHQLEDSPACLIEGQPATVEDGIERAARILAEARYPIIYGLSDTTSEAQRVAVSIGDWIGGCVDTTTSVCHGPSGIAFQDVGEVTCTLGRDQEPRRPDHLLGLQPGREPPAPLHQVQPDAQGDVPAARPQGPLLRDGRRAQDQERQGRRPVHSDQAAQGLRGALGVAAPGQGSRARSRRDRSRDRRSAGHMARR